jgi:hypothetical protein
MAVILTAFVLVSCSTPKTYLQNEKNGHMIYCGGDISSSVSLGFIGYQLQKQVDKECVEEFKKNGYVVKSAEE